MTQPRFCLGVIFLCLLMLLGVQLTNQINVNAQSGCPTLSRLPMAQWRPYATITVYFDQNYQWSDKTKNAIKRAFDNWSAASGGDGNNSGVTFVGFQRGPYPDRNTAVDQFIITKDPAAQNLSSGTVPNPASAGYA